MYDYGLSTLEQYDVNVRTSCRTRGALLCRTEKGVLILREFKGSEKKLQCQQELLQELEEKGCLVDSYLKNREGNLVSRDRDEIPFTLQKWYEGRECDTKSQEDILTSIRALARLHTVMKRPPAQDYAAKSLEEEYRSHNQEIRKIRKFIRRKGAGNLFEKEYLASAEWFLARGEKALAMLGESSYHELRQNSMKDGCICHGEFNQHNVLMLKQGVAVTNFNHWSFDVQMADLYCFMRKILEKYSWDLSLARSILDAYQNERGISWQEWQNLRVRFTYPEKYWKLANYYFSHNKAWISGKNIEKLKKLAEQREIWGNFADSCFGRYPY